MEQLFETMELNKSLVDALKKVNITVPTEIQAKAIPEAQQNKDLIIQSETGTGKTLAYLLPLFEKIDTQKKEMQAIILVPTHELAIQVERQIEMLSQNSELKATSTPIIGDVNIQRQIEKLKLKPHIIVGTSGRILELIQKKKISAHTIKTIIIDEADRLLDDSYIEGTKAVIKTTLKERQILICSASISARTIERAKLFMKEPLLLKSSPKMQVPDTIEHIYFVAEQRDKLEVLRKLVRMINPQKAIAFCGSGEDIEEATEKLKYHKLKAESMHGSNIKMDRKKTMDAFKSGKIQILVATDLAARGLDIEGVTHIINLDIPERSMEYLHRAGRTGRNGNPGVTISIVTEKEIEFIKQYERELNIKITPKSMKNGVMVEYKKSSRNNSYNRNDKQAAGNGQQRTRKTGEKTESKATRNNKSSINEKQLTNGGKSKYGKQTESFSRDDKQAASYSSNGKPFSKNSSKDKPASSSSNGKPFSKHSSKDKPASSSLNDKSLSKHNSKDKPASNRDTKSKPMVFRKPK